MLRLLMSMAVIEGNPNWLSEWFSRKACRPGVREQTLCRS
jgi:hypothetical protein